MSRKPDELELLCIREISKGSPTIQGLIQEKYNAKQDILNSQYASFKKPDPAPKPKGDIRITKRHTVQTRSKEETQKMVERSDEKFDSKIKEELDDIVKGPDHEPIRDIVHSMDAKKLATISEKGIEGYKALEREQLTEKAEPGKEPTSEIDIEQSMKLSEAQMDKLHERTISMDFEDNSKDMDLDRNKAPDPADDFE